MVYLLPNKAVIVKYDMVVTELQTVVFIHAGMFIIYTEFLNIWK